MTTNPAWNKGQVVGKKPPLTPDQVDMIRLYLRQERLHRDLALFNTAIDTCLRGSDLVRLRVSDVATPTGLREVIEVRQQKTAHRHSEPVQVRLSPVTRDSLHTWITSSDKALHGWLFTGIQARWAYQPLTVGQVRRLFKGWLVKIHLDPAVYGLHSLRRTFPSHIYQQTGNLRASQLLLGHSSIENTKSYIGVDQAQALDIAKKFQL